MTSATLDAVVLGGGVTGLAAGIASGAPVFEAEARPGGICSSYYMEAGSSGRRELRSPRAYRFEHGGGHWIFGGHPDVVAMMRDIVPCERIARRSSVWFPDTGRSVGYPLQHHLHQLGGAAASTALAEMLAARQVDATTMAEWLDAQFGPTLGALFFRPFHELYTAGLYREIAPQDGYKTPLDLRAVVQGASGTATPAGYNVTFLYPRDGLDALIGALAAKADLRCNRKAVRIDPARREVTFADGTVADYRRVLSTLPLNRTLELAGLSTRQERAPYTSVLVLNLGARRGPRCPDDHWVYVPRSASGFHRVGFYSNVADHFLPERDRSQGSAVGIYVERSFRGGDRPGEAAVAAYVDDVARELQEWGFIGAVDVADPTWVDVAYTWNRPGSTWAAEAIALLADHDIAVAGRYARWSFQGIADSLRDGFLAGQRLRLTR